MNHEMRDNLLFESLTAVAQRLGRPYGMRWMGTPRSVTPLTVEDPNGGPCVVIDPDPEKSYQRIYGGSLNGYVRRRGAETFGRWSLRDTNSVMAVDPEAGDELMRVAGNYAALANQIVEQSEGNSFVDNEMWSMYQELGRTLCPLIQPSISVEIVETWIDGQVDLALRRGKAYLGVLRFELMRRHVEIASENQADWWQPWISQRSTKWRERLVSEILRETNKVIEALS